MGGVPGGLVMVMEERPGETRNNVFTPATPFTNFQELCTSGMRLLYLCGNLQMTING